MTRYHVKKLAVHPYKWYITDAPGYSYGARYLHADGRWHSQTTVYNSETKVQDWNGLFDSKEEALELLETLNAKPNEIDAQSSI